MPSPINLLIVKTGTTEPTVVEAHGDYDDWFRSHFTRQAVQHHVCQAWLGEALPNPAHFDGILLTGSPASVRDEQQWMSGLSGWALNAAENGAPILAVCFGHQLVGEALGGFIDQNPAGPEYGTIEVELTEDGLRDPLFDGLPSTIRVQSTHRDALVRPPAATLLASTENTLWQAYGWGRRLRSVQFHPEIPPTALAALCKAREINAAVDSTGHGLKILDNWLAYYVRENPSAI